MSLVLSVATQHPGSSRPSNSGPGKRKKREPDQMRWGVWICQDAGWPASLKAQDIIKPCPDPKHQQEVKLVKFLCKKVECEPVNVISEEMC